jgi:uncharacterized membrane-anchored protein YjiN (DUF445 family)
VLELARRDLTRRSYAPMLGQLLGRAVQGDAQRPLVDLIAVRSHNYLLENRVALRPQIKDYLEAKHFLVWLLITDKRVDRLIDFALRELDDISSDQQHPLRLRLDDLLHTFARDLETNEATGARVDLAVRRLFDDERFQQPLRTFIAEAAESFRSSLGDVESGLTPRVSRFIQDIGKRIDTDKVFEATLEVWLRRAVVHAVRDYGDELTVLIRRTVGGWNPQAASRRIEVAVGRDLQFIRINGTVVGALAGLAIHAITLAL